jgi:hypothetical protein
MPNYWFYSDGTNTLSNNILSEFQILEFLLKIPKARIDFQEAYDLLSNDEDKTRILDLINSNRFIKNHKMVSERDVADSIQKKHNTAGIFIFRG